MYQVQIKIKRKTESKAVNEIYLVEASSLTITESLVINEFTNMIEHISKCDDITFQSIFENGKGTFFKIKVESEDIGGNINKELFLQEADNEEEARELFKKNIHFGEITDFNKTKIMGIIK